MSCKHCGCSNAPTQIVAFPTRERAIAAFNKPTKTFSNLRVTIFGRTVFSRWAWTVDGSFKQKAWDWLSFNLFKPGPTINKRMPAHIEPVPHSYKPSVPAPTPRPQILRDEQIKEINKKLGL